MRANRHQMFTGEADANTGLMSLTELATRVAQLSTPIDEKFENGQFFELTGEGPTTEVRFNGRVAGALPMYQVKAACGAANLSISGTDTYVKVARGGDEKRAPAARGMLLGQVNGLNAAIRGSNMQERGFVTRFIEDVGGRQIVGGIVSRQYAPLTHVDFMDRMLATPGFEGAMVHRWIVTHERLDFTLMLANMEWKVDGGIKCGTRGTNGQLGNRAAGLVAMIFRLLCTNGMMDVVEEAGFSKRHTGHFDLLAELKRVIEAAGGMFEAATTSMSIELDVIDALVQLYRRGIINRGAFRKCLERVSEVFGGVQVGGHDSTLWGLSQAITAAARDYGFTQMQQMGVLAGRLVRQKLDGVIANQPLLDDKSDWAELLTATGTSIGRVPVMVQA